jgi:putative ABC transport system substrate-binding protein
MTGEAIMIARRHFVVMAVSALFAWPARSHDEVGGEVRRLATLIPAAEDDPIYTHHMSILRDELAKRGWIEGRNLRSFYRWTDAEPGRSEAFAAELVGLAPDVIFAQSTPILRDLQQATGAIPIIFVSVSDPIGDGFVSSLARPGGNLTGFSNYDPYMIGKWLELLKEIAPARRQAAVIFNPDTAPHSLFLPAFRIAAQSMGRQTLSVPVRSAVEIESAIATLGRGSAVGLMVMPDSFTFAHRDLVTREVARYRLPAVYPFPGFAASGGLISYGVNVAEQYRGAASYIDRILRGAKPGDLPVQRPSKYELVINLKAAKALGITVPAAFLAHADEIIE